MKTFWKITLAGALMFFLSTGAALALSVDYKIDLGNKKPYKYFNDKKTNTFDFDVDLENAVISSVTLSLKHKKNWNRKSKDIWGVAIGDDFYRLSKSQLKAKTISFDITDSFVLGAPFSIALVEKTRGKDNIYLDWISLTVNYENGQQGILDDISDAVNGDAGNGSPAPVPEPGTLVLLGAGLLVVARLGFRKLK